MKAKTKKAKRKAGKALPPFQINPECPACGGYSRDFGIKATYQKSTVRGERDYMALRCHRCKYEWRALTLFDSKKSTKKKGIK